VTLPWEEPGWQEAVQAWIDESLARLQIEGAGPVDHFRERPWAALARVPTVEGDLYFKAEAPSEAYEPALTEWLAGRRADLIADVIRIDGDRAWMLTRDAGRSLRERLADHPDTGIWSELLPLCAELQLELSASVDELLLLGVPDSRPQLLGEVYEDLLTRCTDAEHAPRADVVAQLVERLGDTIPASLTHEELQDQNILLDDGRPVIIDWAEAVIAHPFCGLVNTFRSLVDRWGFEPGSPDLLRLRDAYLEPWTNVAPFSRLVDLFELAYPLGMVCRALSWDRLLHALPGHDLSEFEPFVPAWLEMAAETLQGKARLGS
jgi:Ser/Thr protein kinase RdoA (MazF antagonist)